MFKMTIQEKYLIDFKKLLSNEREPVSEIEMTSENYNDEGNLIEKTIPTITTDFCEIGAYGNRIYFVFVAYSESYSKEFLNALKPFLNAQIYGLRVFKTNFYPKENLDFDKLEKDIKKEKYFQVQFNFNFDTTPAEKLLKEYIILKKFFIKSNVVVVNQLEVNLVK